MDALISLITGIIWITLTFAFKKIFIKYAYEVHLIISGFWFGLALGFYVS